MKHTRFRRTALAAALVLTATCRGVGASVPDPLFFPGRRQFLDQATAGHFSQLQELHLTQYAVPLAWKARWAATRYHQSGLLAQYGSTSARRLHLAYDLALNLRARPDLRLRYDRRQWQDERFDLREERFDALWWPTDRVALAISGWPTHQKQDSAAAFGCRLGTIDGDNGLTLLLRDDRFIFNSKTRSDVRFTRQPVRYLADAHTGIGPLQLFTSLNLGEPYAAEEGATAGGRRLRGSLRHGNAGALWNDGQVVAGLQLRFVTERRLEEDAAGQPSRDYRRDWWRGDLSLGLDRGAWSTALKLGYARQRDRFLARDDLRGSYRAQTWLGGFEGTYRGWQQLGLGLGYLGGSFDTRRAVHTLSSAPPSLRPRSEAGYRDKAHLRGWYHFSTKLAVEMLLSREVSRGTFGGFSVKAVGRL